MATKIGPTNQHEVLHKHYGPEDCCLCRAEQKVEELEKELRGLRMSILESKYVDMTPNEELPERILSAYIDRGSWSDAMPGLEPTNPLCIELNKLSEQRNEILSAAIKGLRTKVQVGDFDDLRYVSHWFEQRKTE